jgi:hypothetical protein
MEEVMAESERELIEQSLIQNLEDDSLKQVEVAEEAAVLQHSLMEYLASQLAQSIAQSLQPNSSS